MRAVSQSTVARSKFVRPWCCLVALLNVVLGCSFNTPVAEMTPIETQSPEKAVVVPSDQIWIDTGVTVSAGQPVTVVANGRIIAKCSDRWGHEQQFEVDPAGTYLANDGIMHQRFPLASGAHGPAPCFCLMGRIGDGPPFFVGRQRSWETEHSGQLWLGINDFDAAENSGEFIAQIRKPQVLEPIGFEEVVQPSAPEGRPQPDCAVVVFYVDGLQPDVVREMVAMGHLPAIKRLFVDGGTGFTNAFTAFPSDTITSNGTMWTGCFSDRHGLKGQVRFSRSAQESESYLDPLGPNRSARLLSPQGVDKLLEQSGTGALKWLRGDEASQTWHSQQTTGIPPLYEILRRHGGDWATGVQPIMTDVPPLLWTRSIVRQMPYFSAHEAWKYNDDANSLYAVRHLLHQQRPVSIIWLPETDSVSHKQCRGQFGMTRRTIAQADLLIGHMVAELEALGRLDKTYFVLVSDHGHHGGRFSHLSHFDIANQLLFAPRQMTSDGQWVGGGWGMSVRQHRSWNRHSEDTDREFVFIDADSAGVARIFLPKGHYRSDDWSGPNRPGDLFTYKIAEHLPPIDLVGSLTAVQATHGNGGVQPPVDLVLVKLTEQSILIETADRGSAVIDRQHNEQNRWVYRYSVVTDVGRASDGGVAYREVADAQTDPLGLLQHLDRSFLANYHDERSWLNATAQTEYPDSVVALTRHMLWQENLRARETEYAPDLVVTARRGWFFGTTSSPGTMHGYPFADSMNASLFVSGPGVRRGARVDTPCRLADLTPTILEMVGIPVESNEFDGTPLRAMYHTEHTATPLVARAVFWRDRDLRAWQPLAYTPLVEYDHQPLTINHPASPFDLNNVAYNLLTVGDWSVFRVLDDVLSPLTNDGKYVSRFVERNHRSVRRNERNWAAQGAQAVNIPELALSDYSLTSLGNLMRVNESVDWIQNRGQLLDHTLAEPFGRPSLPGSGALHGTLDIAQSGFWEGYRFVQRILVQLLDETLVSGFEERTDHAINTFHTLPAEVIVEEPQPEQDTSAVLHETVPE